MRRLILPAVLLFLFGVLLGSTLVDTFLATGDTSSLRKVEDAYSFIVSKYVDQVDTDRLTEQAIYGMLEDLDPHSTYISREDIREVQEGFLGEFGGVGIWYEVVADSPRVSSTVTDGPSEKVGILPGDRIITIAGRSSTGDSTRTVQKRLKGAVGKPIDVTVKRRGFAEPLPFTIIREKIPLYSVDTSYMLDERTGVIKIGRFATTTYDEFMEKVAELTQSGMRRLVVDLRNNPGGIMETAVRITDEFLPAGFDIVETRARDQSTGRKQRSTNGGQLESVPLIVVVNENSASASEILAGAIQDNDRGLVIGERTFGKALVQQQFSLDDGSVLHLTVSRYFTPSGRLIQTPYEGADMSAYLAHKFDNVYGLDTTSLPDSLSYSTRSGRVVAGGGGILPDHIVEPDSTTALAHPLMRALNRSMGDIRFVRDLFDREQDAWRARWSGSQQEFVAFYEVDAGLKRSFWNFVERDALLAEQDVAADDASKAAIDETLSVLLKARLAQNLFGSAAYYPVIQQLDIDLQVAQESWPEAEGMVD